MPDRRAGLATVPGQRYTRTKPYYLDLHVSAAALYKEGAYVRAADQALAERHAVRATIPPRPGTNVRGTSFVANHVLHSGVDRPHGHFVSAYGNDPDARAPPSVFR